jgi:hypothetical protein
MSSQYRAIPYEISEPAVPSSALLVTCEDADLKLAISSTWPPESAMVVNNADVLINFSGNKSVRLRAIPADLLLRLTSLAGFWICALAPDHLSLSGFMVTRSAHIFIGKPGI